MRAMIVTLASALALAAPPLPSQPLPEPVAGSPRAVAESYLSALEAGDLDAAGALFDADSSIVEGGGMEGTWQEYREHHLGPELDEVARFAIRRGETPRIDAAKDGSLVVVTWPIQYTVELAGGEVIESRGAVTFVLAGTERGYRIRQLHWSSRRRPPWEEGAGMGSADASSEDAGGVSEEEAVAIARGQFELEPQSISVEAVEEGGRPAWKVTLRGEPPRPKGSLGEFGEVVIDRATGRILTISQS